LKAHPTVSDQPHDTVRSGGKIRATMLAGPVAGLKSFSAVSNREWETLLSIAGLTPDDVSDAESRIPIEAGFAVFEAAAKLAKRPLIGLDYAHTLSVGGTGFLGFAASNAATVRESLEVLARYIPFVCTMRTCRYEEDDVAGRIIWSYPVSPEVPRLQYAMWGIVAVWKRYRRVFGAEWLPMAVEFDFPAPPQAGLIPGTLAHEIRYDAEECALLVDKRELDAPMPDADPALFAQMIKLGEFERQRVGAVTSELEEKVRAAILKFLHNGAVAQKDIAEELGLSSTTLRDRLKRERLEFRAILNDVRKRSAEHMLRDTSLSITEIAFSLGFSEPSVFTRFCQRELGQSPRQIRARASRK
jgi:AraC-like DNA-binding protein